MSSGEVPQVPFGRPPEDDSRSIKRELKDAILSLSDASSDQVQELVTRDSQESVERIERAQLFPITIEDLERPGGIGETYEQAHIKPETIQLLLEGQHQEYIQRVSDGIFVFGFDEEPLDLQTEKKGPSVFQQMREGLQRSSEQERDQGKFFGWYLAEQKGGSTLAWATCTFPPRRLSADQFRNSYYARHLEYVLSNGITEGGMNYKAMYDTGDVIGDIGNYWDFDTIQGNARYAASRLFANITIPLPL